MVYVKCASHRAREKLTSLLGYKPQSYYNMAVSYHLYEIPEGVLTDALKIKGVSKGKMKEIKINNYIYEFAKTWA